MCNPNFLLYLMMAHKDVGIFTLERYLSVWMKLGRLLWYLHGYSIKIPYKSRFCWGKRKEESLRFPYLIIEEKRLQRRQRWWYNMCCDSELSFYRSVAKLERFFYIFFWLANVFLNIGQTQINKKSTPAEIQ